MNTKVMFSSETDMWATPIEFYNKLNEEFNFTLDPCATDSNHKCEKYYTEQQNGLAQSWEGNTVFCNPPYGRELPKWVKKAYEESLNKDTTVVMLIPARTDTRYFHDYIYNKAEIRFLKGRLKFGDSKNSAPFPSMVVIFKSKIMEDKVLESVINGIEYTPLKDVLVKPLAPIMLEKEVTESFGTGEKDIDGYEKFDTKTEIKEVESEWRAGIVLSVGEELSELKFSVGDTIVYNKKFAKDFDLFKDSQLVKPYDIVAKKK